MISLQEMEKLMCYTLNLYGETSLYYWKMENIIKKSEECFNYEKVNYLIPERDIHFSHPVKN